MNCRSISTSKIATAVFALFVALYFGRGAVGCNSWLWLDITKALPVASLGLITWFTGGKKLLPIALLLSTAGDIAGEHGAFLWQIGFFAVAHIAYIVYFAGKAKFDRSRLWLLVLWIATMVGFGGFVVCNIDNTAFRIACAVYIVIIGTMAASTLFITSPNRWYYTLGAVIFVISDSCIAWNKFIEHFDYAGVTIMTTYFLAQYIFATLYLNDKK